MGFEQDCRTKSGFENAVWDQLERAVTQREHAFRWAALGYCNDQQCPQLRTVMLRQVDTAAKQLTFFTDARSAKVNHLNQKPKNSASLIFLDHSLGLQAAMVGAPTVHLPASNRARTAFGLLSPRQHLDYATQQPPGTACDSITQADIRDAALAPQNFCVIDLAISSFDFVLLTHLTQRLQGQYSQRDDAEKIEFSGQWVTP